MLPLLNPGLERHHLDRPHGKAELLLRKLGELVQSTEKIGQEVALGYAHFTDRLGLKNAPYVEGDCSHTRATAFTQDSGRFTKVLDKAEIEYEPVAASKESFFSGANFSFFEINLQQADLDQKIHQAYVLTVGYRLAHHAQTLLDPHHRAEHDISPQEAEAIIGSIREEWGLGI
jgi:hypothetical protein